MCQQYEAWIDRCGSTWETAFPGDDWHDIEDCYDDHQNADEDQSVTCSEEAETVSENECY